MASIRPSCETCTTPRPLRRAHVVFPDPGGPIRTIMQGTRRGRFVVVMSKFELQATRRRSSRSEKSVLKISLVEDIIRSHEEADRAMLLERNPIAGSQVHFVD